MKTQSIKEEFNKDTESLKKKKKALMEMQEIKSSLSQI
jgi:hypothetical protein